MLAGTTNLCCWKIHWWWYLGAETCRSWHVVWSVFCNLCYCIL